MQTETTYTSLLQQQADALTEEHSQALAELERKAEVMRMLPPLPNCPIICNWNKTTPHDVKVWISFSAPAYDPDGKWNPVSILAAMEERGWKMIPEASLIKFDNWRRSIEPSSLADAQAYPHKSGYKFTDGDAVAPYWVTPNQYTKPEFSAYMRGPNGETYRVALGVPSLRVYISCRRIERMGGWMFDGRASLNTPKDWSIHNNSAAYKDTEQGISGVVYFHADSAKPTASEALQSLIA